MLSEQDVQLLMQEKSSPQARAAVASKVASAFANAELTDQETRLAQDIIQVMVRDISVEVRHSLSESLKSSAHLPREVALRLAQDVESVAMPVLQFSAVLTDEDLLSVINSGGDAKHKAIALRESVSSAVAEMLVEKGSEDTVAALVSNTGADISDKSMERAVTRFPTSEPVQTGLVHREHLPLLLAERLVSVVSDNLRDYLVSKHELKPETVTDIILENRERAIVNLTLRSDGNDIEKLAAQMHANGRLTPSLVLRAICTGDVGFFEAALAVMSNIPLVNARLLIHDAGRLGLKSVYDKSGMPARLLPAIRVALDVVKETDYDGDDEDRSRFRNRVIERILTQYQDMGDDDLNYLVGKIRNMGTPRAA